MNIGTFVEYLSFLYNIMKDHKVDNTIANNRSNCEQRLVMLKQKEMIIKAMPFLELVSIKTERYYDDYCFIIEFKNISEGAAKDIVYDRPYADKCNKGLVIYEDKYTYTVTSPMSRRHLFKDQVLSFRISMTGEYNFKDYFYGFVPLKMKFKDLYGNSYFQDFIFHFDSKSIGRTETQPPKLIAN